MNIKRSLRFFVALLLALSNLEGRGETAKTPKKWETSEALTLDAHKSAVLCVAASPDGRTVATGSNDRTLILWDTRTGKEKSQIRGIGAAVTALVFSPDGSMIVSGSKNRDAVLWNVGTGEEVARFPNHKDDVTAAALSADGLFLAVGIGNGQAGVWDARLAKPLHPLNVHTKAVLCATFSPKDSRVAFGSRDHSVSIWNVKTGKLQQVLNGHRAPIESVAFDSRGGRLVSGSTDKTAIVWDSRDGKELLRLEGHGDAVTFVAFAPDNRSIYTASKDKTFVQWDAQTGKPWVRCELDFPVVHAALSADAFQTVAAGLDDKAYTFPTDALHFLEPGKTGPEKRGPFGHLPAERPIDRLRPDAEVSEKEKTKQKSAGTDRSPEPRAVFLAKGTNAVSTDGESTGFVWNLREKTVQHTFSHPVAFTALTSAPAENHFAVGARDGSVSLFDAKGARKIRSFRGHTAPVNDLVFSPDGKRLLSAGSDRSLVLWNLEAGRSVGSFLGHAGPVNGVAITPDLSTAISVSADGTIRLWEAEKKTFRLLNETPNDKETPPLISLALSPNGTEIAVGADDKTVAVWNLKESTQTTVLTGLAGPARALAYSPDGSILATGGADGVAVFWCANTWKPFRILPQISMETQQRLDVEAARKAATRKKWSREAPEPVRYEPIGSIAFSGDGKFLLTAGGREMFLWDLDGIDASKAPPKHEAAAMEESPRRELPSETTSPASMTEAILALPPVKELRRFGGFKNPVSAAALNRDGTKLVVAETSKRLTTFETSTGGEVDRKTARTPFETLQFLPDGRTLLGGGEDGRLFSINTVTGKDNFVSKTHTDRIRSLAAVPSGAKAVSGGDDRIAVIWDTRRGESLGRLTGHGGAVHRIAVSRDGSKVLTASEDRSAILWDAKTLKPIETFKEGKNPVRSVAFSPDGNRFALGLEDGTVVVSLTANHKELLRFRGFSEPVVAPAFSPTGDRVLAAFEGGNIVFFDAKIGKPVRRFSAPFKPLLDAVLSVDGNRLMAVDPLGATLWNCSE